VLRQAVTRNQWGLGAGWRLAGGEYRQAVWSNFRLAACGLGQAETLLFCVFWIAVFNWN